MKTIEREVKKTFYLAEDGTEFTTEAEATLYDNSKKLPEVFSKLKVKTAEGIDWYYCETESDLNSLIYCFEGIEYIPTKFISVNEYSLKKSISILPDYFRPDFRMEDEENPNEFTMSFDSAKKEHEHLLSELNFFERRVRETIQSIEKLEKMMESNNEG